MKVAIYFRTSTGKQDLTLQKQECIDYCKRQEYSIYTTYEDEAKSGKNLNRVAFKQMLQDAFKGHFQAVIVYSFSRLSRNLRDLLNTLHELDEKKIRVISLKEQLDTETPSGRAMLGMTGVFYQFQREIQNDLIRDKMKQLKEKGVYLGRPKVKVSKEVAKKLHHKGLSVREIAKRMNISKSKAHNVLKGMGSKKGFSI